MRPIIPPWPENPAWRPSRRQEDDALDRLHTCIMKLSGYEQGPEPWLSPQGQADLATVREALERRREELAALGEYREELAALHESRARDIVTYTQATEAKLQRITEGLRRIEWIDRGEGYDECAYCGMAEIAGHEETCSLAAFLADIHEQ